MLRFNNICGFAAIYICCNAYSAYGIEKNANRVSIFEHEPHALITYDQERRNYTSQHQFSLNLPVSPYVSFGSDGSNHEDNFYDVQNEWRHHSYESAQHEKRERQRWAGFKLRLSKLFKMNIDPKERRVRSTLAISPKTKVKVRANLREIRADMIYRF